MSACERQLRRIQDAFFKSIIRQEIGWFDCQNTGLFDLNLLK
jgi:hypothetical protein